MKLKFYIHKEKRKEIKIVKSSFYTFDFYSIYLLSWLNNFIIKFFVCVQKSKLWKRVAVDL